MRTGHILQELDDRGSAFACICRGSQKAFRHGRIIGMGRLGHVPRLLNAIRIYIWSSFNHRIYDIALFEWFATRFLKKQPKENVELAHVWDVCPTLIRNLKQRGATVLLDVPIAPASYCKRMNESGSAAFLDYNAYVARLENESFKLADLIIAPSRFVADELQLAGIDEEKIRIVEFGVAMPALRENFPLKEKENLDYCFVGNVNIRKGVAELLDVWSDEGFAQDRLHLCGRVFPEIKALLSSRHLPNVRTPGFMRPMDYLQGCDVFVLPSWFEGSAKAVFEAMACGLPVITTRSSGSIVRDGIDGFVIEAGDRKTLLEKMQWMKQNPDRRREMGLAARNHVAQYSWNRYAQRIVSIYDEELGKRDGNPPNF